MTETSQTTPQPSLRTELRIARDALGAFRQDLLTDAFAFRPAPPLPDGHALLRALPQRVRPQVRWLPQAAIITFTLILMLGAMADDDGLDGGIIALLTGAPLLFMLFRPLGGWWLSFAASAFTGMALGDDFPSPWTATGFVSHIAVMAFVATRSRPRVAAEMWLLTVLLGLVFNLSSSWGKPSVVPMAIVSGILLLAVLAVRGLRESKQEVAVQVAVTEVERSRRTVLEERTTIARELHDVVAHHMSVIAIQAEAAPYRVDNPPEELTRSFAVIRENAVIALTELRRVLGVVRAEDYEAPQAPQPTLAVLDSLLANVRDAGLTVDKVVTGAVRDLPQGVELSAYRIIQEALSNTLRHAPGAPARVELSYVPVGLGLRILNGPPTAAPPPSPGAGHGLLGMQERAAVLGGEVTAEQTPDGGYEVVAFLPVGSDA
ncbi:sensor histidine kinase [Streptomyces sp. NBC_01262]|uniref:sensor histidine kinase n=1 Tax=Streptomyces sp. NBC_01262 TaxID=2903803 RepID=UPI002E3269A3|nr:histidine kinase [Streptomyces sp. NBC_01262]